MFGAEESRDQNTTRPGGEHEKPHRRLRIDTEPSI